MMRQVKVYLGNPKMPGQRKLIEAELIQERGNTLFVKLPDGNIITRRKSRDVPKEKQDEIIQ